MSSQLQLSTNPASQQYRLTVFDQDAAPPEKTSFQKQPYDPEHFRKRYVTVLQKIAMVQSKALLPGGEYQKMKISEPDYPLKAMDESYADESVRYFTKAGLEDRQVFLINGLFCKFNYELYLSSLIRAACYRSAYNLPDPEASDKCDFCLYNSTVDLDARRGNGEMIVMDKTGNIFISPKERNVYHHSSFFSGNPLAFAGLCSIKDGVMQRLVPYSGHYTPGRNEVRSFFDLINSVNLVEAETSNPIKITKDGTLVETIPVTSSTTLAELSDMIAKTGGYINDRLLLINNGKILRGSNLTLAELGLVSGARICAMESRKTPPYRIYPIQVYDLQFAEQEKTSNKISP